MHKLRGQAGASALTVVLGLVLATFVVVLVFKVLPPYMEYYGVVSSLKSFETEVDMHRKSKAELLKLLKRRLDLNDVKRVGKEDITVVKKPRETTIRVAYEVQVPLISNMDLLLTFDNVAMLH